jgi:hypothetical protein
MTTRKLPGRMKRAPTRPIGSYEGYEVSSFGRLRSWRIRGRYGGRPGHLRDEPRYLKGAKSPNGYLVAYLNHVGETARWVVPFHILVLEAFVGPRPHGMQGCHWDDDPTNNRLDNLRWDTPRANRLDSLRNGCSPLQTIAADDIPSIWARIAAGEVLAKIAEDFGVTGSCVSSIKSGKVWSHITRNLSGARPAVQPARNPVYPPAEVISVESEIWRHVPGFPAYRVSNWGGLQSRWIFGGRHSWSFGENWRDIKFSSDKDGYCVTVLSDGRRRKGVKAHILVLESFVAPRPAGMFGCHSDGDRRNNHVRNLRWDTPKANAADRDRHAAAR